MPATAPKISFRTPKNFLWVVVAGLLVASQAGNDQFEPLVRAVRGFIGNKLAVVVPTPVLPLGDLSEPYKAFSVAVASLTPQQVAALQDYYSGLARALRSDPQGEPVLPTTTSVRTAHRAGLLFLWKGSLDSVSNPSLQSSIEGVLDSLLGRESVPLNPSLRQKAADGFDKLAQICASSKA